MSNYNKNSGIVEIFSSLQDKRVLQNDFAEIAQIMQKMMADKYINRFQTVIKTKQNEVMEKPSKEISLLQTMKLFVNEQSHSKFDNLISNLTMLETAKGLSGEIGPIKNSSLDFTPKHRAADVQKNIQKMEMNDDDLSVNADDDSSIHEDGIYDIDNSCLIKKQQKQYFGIFSKYEEKCNLPMLAAVCCFFLRKNN